MGLMALVMAGGKGRRVGQKEKPLLRVCGKPMIQRVLEALEAAEEVSEIVVAVSKHTLKTKDLLKRLGVKTVDTSGDEYVSDMRDAVKQVCTRGPVLIVAADLPLLTSEIIDEVIREYRKHGKPALTVVVPTEVVKSFGIKPSLELQVEGRSFSPVGLNLIDSDRLDEAELEEHILVSNKPELAFNVNSVEDVKLAEEFSRAP
jgi:adenosylcobinamide-phosphate guanylyltransferase